MDKPQTPKREYYLYLGYRIRQYTPKSHFFYSMNYFLKFISFILLTHNISGLEDNAKSIQSKLQYLTFFSSCGFEPYINSFPFIVIAISVLLICFTCYIRFLIYFTGKHLREEDFKKNSNYQNIIIHNVKIIVLITDFIFLFSQHLVEYNFLGIINIFFPNTQILSLNNTKKFFILIFCVLNIVIIYLIVITFLYFSDTFSFFSKNQNKELNKKRRIRTILLSPVIQGIYSCLYVIYIKKGKKERTFLIYFNFIILAFFLIQLWSGFKAYNFYFSNPSVALQLFLSYFSLFSSFTELIFKYYTKTPLTQRNSLCKFFFLFIISLIMCHINIKYMFSSIIKKIKRKILNEKELLSLQEIMVFMEYLYRYKNLAISFVDFSKFFSYHQLHCTREKCPCLRLKLESWSKIVSTIPKNPKTNELEEYNKNIKIRSFDDFVIVGESEIEKAIAKEYKSKHFSNIELLIILHIEYLFKFKNEKKLALYYTNMYYYHTISKKFSMKTLLYLYEYNRRIYHELTEVQIEEEKVVLGDPLRCDIGKEIQIYQKNMKLYFYMLKIQKIFFIISKCCEIGNKIFDFKRNVKIKTNNNNKYYSSSENFISLCFKFKKMIESLFEIVESIDGSLKHLESCYMISIFCKVVFGYVPKKIKKIIGSHSHYSSFKEKCKIYNSYAGFKVKNPLLAFISKNDEFIIKYAARNIYTILEYNPIEIKESPINILIPNHLNDFHKILLKKFALFSNKSFTKSSFIVNKKKNLINAKFIASTIPSLDNNIGIILNVEFPPSKKNTTTIDYSFLLDSDFKILLTNQNVYDEFFFSIDMINLLKMDYCTFFGINPEKLRRDIRKNSYCVYQRAKLNLSPTSLGDESKVLSVFSTGKLEYIFNTRDSKKLTQIIYKHYPKIKYSTFLTKASIINNIPLIHKTIDEMGLDIEWYARTNCFKDRLQLPNSQLFFNVQYIYCSLGPIAYYMVYLNEKVNITSHQENMDLFKENLKHLNLYSIKGMKHNETIMNQNSKFLSTLLVNNNQKIEISHNNHLASRTLVNFPFHRNMNTSLINKYEVKLPNYNQITPKSKGTLNYNLITTNKETNISVVSSQNSSINLFLQNNNSHSGILGNVLGNQSFKFYRKKRKPISRNIIVNNSNKIIKWKKMRINMVIIFRIMSILILFLSCFFALINMKLMQLFKGLFDINVYALLVKSDIYFSSICISEFCTMADINNQEYITNEKWKLKFRGSELIEHFTNLLKKINNLAEKVNLDNIYDVLTEKEQYKIILSTFEPDNFTSCLKEEILLFHYKITQLQKEGSFESCRVRQIFSYQRYKNLTVNETYPSLNQEEKIFFYIIENVMKNIKNKMETLTREINKLLHKNALKCKKVTIVYNGIIFILCIILLLLYLPYYINNVKELKYLLVFLYTEKRGEINIEKELILIREAVKNFTDDNCKKLELFREEIKSTAFLIEQEEEEFIKKKKNISFSNSINSNKKISKYKINKEDKEGELEEDIYLPNNLLISKFFILSLVLFLFLITVCITFEIVIIIFSYKNFEVFEFMNIILINFIDRIPKISELFIYLKISICLNDIFFITVPPSEYNSESYSNYYNVKFDLEGYTTFDILKDSNMAFLYYQSLQIQGNIEAFLNFNADSTSLKETIKWENYFNKENGVCIYGSLGFQMYSSVQMNLIDNFKIISDTVNKCKLLVGGIALNPLNNFIQFSLRQMIYVYTDFARIDANKRNVTEFLRKETFTETSELISGPLKKIHNIIIFTALKDKEIAYKNANILGIIFSFVSIVIGIAMIIEFNLLSINKIKEKIDILIYMKTIIDNDKNHKLKKNRLNLLNY